jgi:glycosylphosphatidylinositol deacylase
MRRRPSGSGEDDNGSRSASTASDRLDKSRDSSNARDKDTARDVKLAMSRPQERKTSKDPSRTPVLEINSQWDPAMEPKTELHNDTVHSPVQTKGNRGPASDGKRQRARMRNPWSCSTLTFATSICAIVLLTTILHSFFTRQQDPKGCAMSYMRPAFARYSDFDTEHTRFATKYSLYLYREGGVDEDTRVKGIPVLFIPGNAGSYKQVRPIAAEAAHYYHDVLRLDKAAVADGKAPFHGQTLLDQAEYLNEAVAFILALYHNPSRSLREPGFPEPKSVIILGHSMGGVVARTMLRMPNYQEHTVNTIVTLSAPHARAPVTFDADMVATYHDINTYWRKSYLEPPSRNPLADVTLVSVAGGGLDTMIPSESTSLTSLVPDTHGFTVFTSSIPNVWTGMDHLAIMWCDQFRKALVKAVFDVVDVRRSAQTKPQAQRIKAIRKRLLTGMEPVVQKSIRESGKFQWQTFVTTIVLTDDRIRHTAHIRGKC